MITSVRGPIRWIARAFNGNSPNEMHPYINDIVNPSSENMKYHGATVALTNSTIVNPSNKNPKYHGTVTQ